VDTQCGPDRTRIGAPVLVVITAITLSLIGLYIQRIATAWVMWTMTHSSLWVASVAMADLLSTLVVSGPAGALIDRFRPAATYWFSQVVACGQGVALFVLAELDLLGPVSIVVCAACLGVCNAFNLPARFSLIPLLVRREQYVRVVTLNSLAGNAAMFLAPMISGWLMSGFGLNVALAANIGAYIPVICVIPMVRTIAPDPVKRHPPGGLVSPIVDGFVYTLRNPDVFSLLLAFAGLSCTVRGIVTLAPSIAAIVLHGDIEVLAALSSSLAIGGMAGGLLTMKGISLSARPSIIVTMAGGGLSLLAYGLLPNQPLALCGAFALGVMLSLNSIAVTSAIQLSSEADYRGRVNSLYNVVFKGGPALGAAFFGFVAELVDIRVSVVLAAILLPVMLAGILRISELNGRSFERSDDGRDQ